MQSAKLRGWLAFAAGAFLVLFIAAIWLWIDRQFAARDIVASDPAAARYLGKIHVAFALVVVAGVLGAINGWIMVRSGRRNLALVVALVVAFAAAVFVAAGASSGGR
jgi:hypothetical protein